MFADTGPLGARDNAEVTDTEPEAYEPPRIVVLGTVAELTAGPPGMSTDGVLGDMMGVSM